MKFSRFYALESLLLATMICLLSCSPPAKLLIPSRSSSALAGSEFYQRVSQSTFYSRERIALVEIFAGNMPDRIKDFERIESVLIDSSGRRLTAYYWVSPDYISIGSDKDFARIPLSPMAAQIIADSFNCFLPTPLMVDQIYQQSAVKLMPVPLFAHRDSSLIFWHHHLIIEGQREQRKGLIAGIKKDVVLSSKVLSTGRSDRVAIYGWHQLTGKPIQPVYAGHVNWYVDYSHGVRLVYRKLRVEGRWLDYTEVLKHPVYKKFICAEDDCSFERYLIPPAYKDSVLVR